MHVKATDTHALYASMFLENLSAARFVLSDTRTNGKICMTCTSLVYHFNNTEY